MTSKINNSYRGSSRVNESVGAIKLFRPNIRVQKFLLGDIAMLNTLKTQVREFFKIIDGFKIEKIFQIFDPGVNQELLSGKFKFKKHGV